VPLRSAGPLLSPVATEPFVDGGGVQPIARAIGGAIARGSHLADLGVAEGDRSTLVDALGLLGFFPVFWRSSMTPSSISATMPNTVRIIPWGQRW
jgi:hypothetical protein